MYKNRIHRTATSLNLQSLIRRAGIQLDERARFVEFDCNVWNEGRFGPDLADPVTLDWSDRPEPVTLFDLGDIWQNGPNCLPSAISPDSALKISQGRAGCQVVEAAFRKAEQMGFLATSPLGTHLTSVSSSNQGRGSP